jgi:hypothetical protein
MNETREVNQFKNLHQYMYPTYHPHNTTNENITKIA